jgi:hypothetical protein
VSWQRLVAALVLVLSVGVPLNQYIGHQHNEVLL